MIGPEPGVLIFDDFVAPDLLAALLAHALDPEAEYAATKVGAKELVVPTIRSSLYCQAGLGPHEAAFTAAVHARLDEIYSGLGIRPYPIADTELELVAHGDGGFYQSHIDIYTQASRFAYNSDRIISSVFYFHRQPKAFTGGGLAIFPFASEVPSQVIEPRSNRLVVFPSFVPHAVQPIACPSGAFADSRFAINCWLNRARK